MYYLQTAELEEKEALILKLTDKIGVLQVAVSQNEVNNQILQGELLYTFTRSFIDFCFILMFVYPINECK